MLEVARRLQALKAEVQQRKTACEIGREQSRNSILMLGGSSGGGANFNVVPERCWFTLDRRINPEEDLATEKQRIISVLEDCRRQGIRLEWEILQEGRSTLCRQDAPLAQALATSVESVTGEPAKFEMCPGLLELRFYSAQNIPAYAYGPGLLSVAHGPNEYVDLRKVRDSAAIYALTAIEMLSSSGTLA
jgi:succinyl-diaminopimelate desuccinylase